MTHAKPQAIEAVIKRAVISLVRDVLAPFSDHARIRARMDRIMEIPRFTFASLRSLGIEYVSPVDITRRKLSIDFDFVYSFSVLEHVPCDDVDPLLDNLCGMMSSGGTMIHAIHLEDHKDTARYPFEFLSIPEAAYSRRLQTARGNRIRLSEWRKIFGEIPGTVTEPIYVYHRRDRPLPDRVDPSVRHTDAEDLRVSHIGMYTRKG
jgi:hypothetical protein